MLKHERASPVSALGQSPIDIGSVVCERENLHQPLWPIRLSSDFVYTYGS
jgi:hypothetical protein